MLESSLIRYLEIQTNHPREIIRVENCRDDDET